MRIEFEIFENTFEGVLKAINLRFNDLDIECDPNGKRTALVDVRCEIVDMQKRFLCIKKYAEDNGLLDPDLKG